MVKLNHIEVILWLRGVDDISMMLGSVVTIGVMTERMMRMAFNLVLMICSIVVVMIREMDMCSRPLHCEKGSDEDKE